MVAQNPSGLKASDGCAESLIGFLSRTLFSITVLGGIPPLLMGHRGASQTHVGVPKRDTTAKNWVGILQLSPGDRKWHTCARLIKH